MAINFSAEMNCQLRRSTSTFAEIALPLEPLAPSVFSKTLLKLSQRTKWTTVKGNIWPSGSSLFQVRKLIHFNVSSDNMESTRMQHSAISRNMSFYVHSLQVYSSLWMTITGAQTFIHQNFMNNQKLVHPDFHTPDFSENSQTRISYIRYLCWIWWRSAIRKVIHQVKSEYGE